MAQDTSHRRHIRVANAEKDAESILSIYTPFVRDTPISLEFDPPTLQEMTTRISSTLEKFPWLVYEKDNKILGFTYGSPHRIRKGYQWTVETGLYILPNVQKQGIGKELYKVLFEMLKKQGYYTVLGGITLPNEASLQFHLSNGFEQIGIYKNVGFKLGKWWDTTWLQKEIQPYGNVQPEIPIPFSQIDF